MTFERNEHPFDDKGQGKSETPLSGNNVPSGKPENVITLRKSHIAIISIALVAVLVISIAVSFILYNVYLRKLYPLPVNQNNHDINYSFTEEPLIAIADMNAKYIVEVKLETPGVSRNGSGVIFKFDNVSSGKIAYILTNYHVIADYIVDSNVIIKLFGSAGFSLKGSIEVLGFDAYNDVAVLRFKEVLPAIYGDGIKLPSYISVSGNNISIEYNFERSFGEAQAAHDEDMLVMGKRVLAIGNALGQGTSACDGIVSTPINYIKKDEGSGVSKVEYYNTVVQITAPINPGNSGGGLFDMKGQFIGINTYRARTDGSGNYVDNISYAIPAELALSSAYRIIRYYKANEETLIQERKQVMTPFNLGLKLEYDLKVLGVQETSVLKLERSSADIAYTWGVSNNLVTEVPKNTVRQSNGEYLYTVEQFAGVSFAGGNFDSLSLTEKKMLLLKVECNLYNYSNSGTGEALTLTQDGNVYTTNIKKII